MPLADAVDESAPAQPAPRTTSVLSVILTVLAVVATTLAIVSVWTFRTLTDTDLFVSRVGSIVSEPEVATAVSDAAARILVDAVDLEEVVAGTLPGRLGAVAGPLTTAVEDYLARGAQSLVGTDAFQQAWEASLTAGHTTTIAVLSGQDTSTVGTSNGAVVLNLAPMVNALVDQATGTLSELLGRDVTAPALDEDDLDSAIEQLEQRLGTDLPADVGQVVLFRSDSLALAQTWYQAVRTSVWLAPVAAVVLAGLAVAASTRRVRTALWIVIGTAVLLGLVAVLLDPLRGTVLANVADAGLAGAVGAAFDTVFGSLLTGIVVVVGLGIIAALALVVTRDGSDVSGSLRQAQRFVAGHRGLMLGAGALVALLLLAVLPGPGWAAVLVLLLLYAAYAVAVLLARPQSEPAQH